LTEDSLRFSVFVSGS